MGATMLQPRRGQIAAQKAAMVTAMLQKGTGRGTGPPLVMVGQTAVTAVMDIEAQATKVELQASQVELHGVQTSVPCRRSSRHRSPTLQPMCCFGQCLLRG